MTRSRATTLRKSSVYPHALTPPWPDETSFEYQVHRFVKGAKKSGKVAATEVKETFKDFKDVFERRRKKGRRDTVHRHRRKHRKPKEGYTIIAGRDVNINHVLFVGYVFLFLVMIIIVALWPRSEGSTKKTENMIVDNINGEYLVPGNPITGGGWNDTPTIGMTGEYLPTKLTPHNVLVKETNKSVASSTVPPAGMPATSPKYCDTPTGFLMRAVQAYNQGLRTGIVNMDGVDVDMGTNGAFWDRWGDGCCDSYCRLVTNGGYWSCIDPSTRTSQYLQSLPRGKKCEKYGNALNVLP